PHFYVCCLRFRRMNGSDLDQARIGPAEIFITQAAQNAQNSVFLLPVQAVCPLSRLILRGRAAWHGT
ncbi:hypothetical protein, partial [Hoeflea sp.]|uniref:hypothetical protein n=1 Tax=Hoeflea sp. TaxID=1940281 RepID=UPI0025BCDFC0